MRSVFWAVCAAATLFTATTAAAETNPGPAVHEIKQIWRDTDDVIHNISLISVYQSYCKAPHANDKSQTQAAIDEQKQRLQDMAARHQHLESSFHQAGTTSLGRSYRDAFPKLEGLEATHRDYWVKSNAMLKAAQRAIDAKQKRLDAARERDCSGSTDGKTAERIGGDPPVRPVEAPIPSPQFIPVSIPQRPARFCSHDEKDAWLAALTQQRFDMIENEKRAYEWAQALQARISKGAADVNHLRALHRSAIAQREAYLAMYKQAERLYVDVRDNMQVEKCGADAAKQVGALPSVRGDWAAATAAHGDIKLPFKPYLSTEVGGNLRLGVVQLERESDVSGLSVSAGSSFAGTGLKIGLPTSQFFAGYVELSRYDYTINARAPDIATTSEGVGIPGTGDLSAMYPAGVFFANPAFNDVEGISSHHRGEWQGVKIGVVQKSQYGFGSVSLGAGLSYGEFETTDIVAGSIPLFLTDFRYATDIDTRNFGLFVRGGIEVSADQFWDTALRYAGEFSGFRLRADAEVGANFLDAKGEDRLDLFGFVSDAQRVRVGQDDTTFGYKVSAGLGYTPPGVLGLEMSIGVEYGENEIHPVPHHSGQTGDTTQIEFEEQEVFVGTLRTTFTF